MENSEEKENYEDCFEEKENNNKEVNEEKEVNKNNINSMTSSFLLNALYILYPPYPIKPNNPPANAPIPPIVHPAVMDVARHSINPTPSTIPKITPDTEAKLKKVIANGFINSSTFISLSFST